MAIYRGTGGSVESITESDVVTIAISQGGTGAQTAADARANLGLGTAATTDSSDFATAAQGALADSALQSDDIGVAVQAYDAQLSDVAGLTPTDKGVIIGNGNNFVVESGSTLRSSLGLAIGTDVLAPNGSAASLTSFPTLNQNTTGTADNVTGVVAIANGGTGQTTAVAARAALLPSYATNGGKILAVKADASDVEYIEVAGTGTVTSVGMSVPTGLSVSGSPVTTSGTLAVTYTSGYAIPTTAKQTEWDTAYTKANTALQSSDIGVSIQGYDADTTKNDVANTFTANQVISVTDNTNAALRITQLGTGNALLVEDSSNPDSTPFVIDASGNVLKGYGTPLTIGYTSAYQQHSTTIANSSMQLGLWAVSTSSAQFIYAKSRGAVGTQTILQDDDAIGTTRYYGSDGTSMIEAARIEAFVDGTPGTNDMPGRLVFSTTADGASSPTERMRIGSDGITRFGNSGGTNENNLQIVPTTGSDVTIRTNRTGTGVSHVPLYLQGGTGDPVQVSTTGGLTVPRTAVTSPATTDGNVFSGTYTPSLTNTTNITSSSAFTFSYMRVGNVVTVQGRVTIVPASAAACELNIALPIASNLALESLSGCVGPTSVYTVGICDGNATLDTARILFTAPATTSRQWAVHFTYRII